MNTGIQRSSATPHGASTTTTPVGSVIAGQQTYKKNVPAIVADHEIPYVATASISYPFDYMAKIKKAMEAKGPSYIHVYSVCPTGWRSKPEIGIELGRLAVETGVFPLYEVENGLWRMTKTVKELKSVREYLKPQGRFRHLSDEVVDRIQEMITARYSALVHRCAAATS